MNASTMIDIVNRQPFEPIEVHLSDGEVLTIESLHLIATGRNKPTFILYTDEDETTRYVSYRNITQVVTKEPTGA
ncbi:MAG: hypothetical protein AAFV43_13795 [Planctomycetota bacterium]